MPLTSAEFIFIACLIIPSYCVMNPAICIYHTIPHSSSQLLKIEFFSRLACVNVNSRASVCLSLSVVIWQIGSAHVSSNGIHQRAQNECKYFIYNSQCGWHHCIFWACRHIMKNCDHLSTKTIRKSRKCRELRNVMRTLSPS